MDISTKQDQDHARIQLYLSRQLVTLDTNLH